MAGLLRGNLLEEMSFWISATVDDTCIPLAAADHSNIFGAHLFRVIPVSLSRAGKSEASGYEPEMNEAGGWTSSLPTSHQGYSWQLQFTWRSSLIPSRWAEAGERVELLKGDQRAIDWVCCFLELSGTASASAPTLKMRLQVSWVLFRFSKMRFTTLKLSTGVVFLSLEVGCRKKWLKRTKYLISTGTCNTV